MSRSLCRGHQCLKFIGSHEKDFFTARKSNLETGRTSDIQDLFSSLRSQTNIQPTFQGHRRGDFLSSAGLSLVPLFEGGGGTGHHASRISSLDSSKIYLSVKETRRNSACFCWHQCLPLSFFLFGVNYPRSPCRILDGPDLKCVLQIDLRSGEKNPR